MTLKFKKIFLLIAGAFLLLFVFSGCGTVRRINYPVKHTYFPVFDSKNYGITKHFPKSFTIYPFKNTTWYEASEARAREAAFQAFSLIGPCASMDETDKLASRIYTPSDAMRVARKQGTDAFVIGEAVYQDHVWLLILAYSYVEIKISVYATDTGRLLWTGSTSSSSSEVGVSIILTPILTIIEHGLWSRKTAALYYSANMDIIHDMRPDALAVK
jgi:hypothetical protein